jgi:hypothetical protein
MRLMRHGALSLVLRALDQVAGQPVNRTCVSALLTKADFAGRSDSVVVLEQERGNFSLSGRRPHRWTHACDDSSSIYLLKSMPILGPNR